MKKKIIGMIAAAAMTAGFSAHANEIDYSYSQNNQYYAWGAKLAQTYDGAIYLSGASFGGNKITSIMVPVLESENISDYKIWLTTELKLETVNGKKVNVADVMSADVEPQDFVDEVGYISYDLPEPYEITADGIYVGYSLKVNKLGSDKDRYPMLITTPGAEGGFWVHSSSTYRAWSDRAAEADAVHPIRVTLSGDFTANAVTLDPVASMYAGADQPQTVTVTVHNVGSEPVASFDYEVTSGDIKGGATVELADPIPAIFNRAAEAEVEIPGLPLGKQTCTLKITKVNGVDNGRQSESTFTVTVLNKVPVKRPLMEEFTGTWCGWCPRGWIAMEKMHELHPDFICISYHNGDAMQLSKNYPNMVDGFPGSTMDRVMQCDPYYGESQKDFGIEGTWQKLCEQFTTAEVTVEATLEDGKIVVNSDVEWIDDMEGDYGMVYVLTGDKMSDPAWVQGNNYASYNPAQGGLYMEPFCRGGQWGQSKVPLLEFSDVALLCSSVTGLEGSVPNLTAGSHNPYTYTFDLSGSSLWTKASDLHVVAILLQNGAAFGKVINCNIATVEGYNAVQSIIGDSEIKAVKYYDLSGRELRDAKGIVIRSVTYSDGRVINSKVVR